MKTALRLASLATLALLLSACSSHPAGVSLAEWHAMTPRQKREHHQRELQQHKQDMRSLEAFSLALGTLREDR